MSTDKLRSLVQQAQREIRVYENALMRADEDAAAMPALLAETKKWHELQKQIIQLRLNTPSLSPELKIEIKKLDDAIDTLREKELLVIRGQVKQAETLPEAAEIERIVRASHSASAKIAQIKDEAKHHMAEFARQWLSKNNLTEASLTEVQKTDFEAAIRAEFTRWIKERFTQLDSESSKALES